MISAHGGMNEDLPELTRTAGLQNYEIINGSCFKPLVSGKWLSKKRKPTELAAEMGLLWMAGKATIEKWGLSNVLLSSGNGEKQLVW